MYNSIMPSTKPIRDRIKTLKRQFDEYRVGKESLIKIIDESELSESVYNSNAIEIQLCPFWKLKRSSMNCKFHGMYRYVKYLRRKISHVLPNISKAKPLLRN